MSISRQQLQLITRKRLKYPLDIAEKDYHLALAMHRIIQSDLHQTLVFKGGTALHHCYLPQHRFSEDLDFTSLDRALTLDAAKQALTSDGFFQVRKEYESRATIKFERLWYPGILDQPGSIKVEIDRMQNVVLPAQALPYENVWNLTFSVHVMDIREMCAEKIRATSQRARYRDFYDLYLILDTFDLEFSEVISLLPRKEVREPIRHDAMLVNWQIAKGGKVDDLRSIFCTRKVDNRDIEALIQRLWFQSIHPE